MDFFLFYQTINVIIAVYKAIIINAHKALAGIQKYDVVVIVVQNNILMAPESGKHGTQLVYCCKYLIAASSENAFNLR